MSAREFAIQRLKVEEGFSAVKYLDHLGKPTIGYGTLLPLTAHERTVLKVPADPSVLAEGQCLYLLDHRFHRFADGVDRTFAWLEKEGTGVQAAVYDMSYNIGIPRLRGFKKMLAALQEARYDDAARECLDSRYASQVPNRARRNAFLMREAGGLPPTVQDLYDAAP